MRTPALGLGTVQFGMPYGVSNQRGQVTPSEVAAILSCAARHGVSYLDTAALYGTSEAVLGETLPESGSFRIVTKAPKFGTFTSAAEAVAQLREAFAASLAKLGQGEIYGLLLHDADDLLGPHGAALWGAMESLQRCGRVRKIGASVSSGPQIDAIVSAFPIQLIQVPYNLLDGRLVSGGQLIRLARSNVEIHARSIFLQGLLLAAPDRLDQRFDRIRPLLQRLRQRLADADLSPLEGALGAALQRPEIDVIVFGVTSLGELKDIFRAVDKLKTRENAFRYDEFSIYDESILNPALWDMRSAP